MPQWVVVAAVLAALGYVVLSKKEETTKQLGGGSGGGSGETPKAAYDRGYKEGLILGASDAKEKKVPAAAKVGTTVDQAPDEIMKDRLEKAQNLLVEPDSWMNDAKKSYALGFNLGYSEAYLKNYVKEWKPEKTPPADWPTNCPWPPASKDVFDSTMAKAAKFTDDGGAMAMKHDAPYWWPTAWGWPPVCAPKDWPSGEDFPFKTMNKKTFEDFKSRHPDMTIPEHLSECDQALNVLGKMSSDSQKMADITRQMLKFGSDSVALENIAKMVDAGLAYPGITAEQKDAAFVVIRCCNDKATALRAMETPLTKLDTVDIDSSGGGLGGGGLGGFGGGGIGGFGPSTGAGNQRVSPEWRNQIPNWYANPSFRRLR